MASVHTAADVSRPERVTQFLAIAVAVVGALAALVDVRPGAHAHVPWEWRAAAVAAIGLVWLLELAGRR